MFFFNGGLSLRGGAILAGEGGWNREIKEERGKNIYVEKRFFCISIREEIFYFWRRRRKFEISSAPS